MDKSESIILRGNCSNRDHLMSNDLMDLSNVRVLLCDTDAESCQEVLALLKKCCYQVIPVSSAVDALDALNSQGPCIDIILAEASLLISNGTKIFNFIKLDMNLKHIPVIMMLDEDEVPLVLKGLVLGATDYLVKPFSSIELMKLWTHMKRNSTKLVY
ncbi:PREDICTED: two-component response regulator-like APRR1 [Nicotiana attenuata]|uniref:Two-component response regulator-like aprr1 n=1 Tax=Nicotiana attenuata TaxID=49451 RepID=A0A1J6KJG9_NICAT|nr:PREDICTED: two-component response regulator-like APRR1 [Nicotiana attenuata]OIT22923.1 two-component response regulator-like aprr1 [Nicotiana attenuata]